MTTIRTLSLAAGLSLAGTIAAQAATLDFTDLTTFTGPKAISASAGKAEGTIGLNAAQVTWTLTPSTRPMRYNFADDSGAPAALIGNDQGYDGTGKNTLKAASGLELDGDGLGIGGRDDEITGGDRNESITLTFTAPVRILGIYVLDLFQGVHEGEFGQEIANITGDLMGSITGTQTKSTGNNAGFKFIALDSGGFNVTSLTFSASATNLFGDDGVLDFALAGVDYELAPIPVPAGGILLLTAMAGLAAVHRRKQA